MKGFGSQLICAAGGLGVGVSVGMAIMYASLNVVSVGEVAVLNQAAWESHEALMQYFDPSASPQTKEYALNHLSLFLESADPHSKALFGDLALTHARLGLLKSSINLPDAAAENYRRSMQYFREIGRTFESPAELRTKVEKLDEAARAALDESS